MGTYPSFLVHLVAAAFAYLVIHFTITFVRRKLGDYWLWVSYPAVAGMMFVLAREIFDRGSILKSWLDLMSWLVGFGLTAWAAHRLNLFPGPKGKT